MQLTDKEQQVTERYAAYLHNNEVSNAFIVSILKLTLDYTNSGSAAYLANQNNVTPQCINKSCDKIEVNGLTIYTKSF